MTQPAYGKVYPFEGDEQAGDAEYRHMGTAYGDGIVNDTLGTAFAVAPSGSDRTIVVTLAELRVRGIHFEGLTPFTTTITLSAPSAGFTRVDRIVAHYDPTDESISIVKIEGSAVNTGVPAAPALTRASGGVWEIPLWRFTGGTGAASTLAKIDDRCWIAERGLVANQGALSTVAPIGTEMRAIDTGIRYLRKVVSGTPTWVDQDTPTWVAFSKAGPLTDGGTAPFYTKVGGRVQLRGSLARTSGADLMAAGAGSDVALGTVPAGFLPSSTRNFAAATSNGPAVRVSIDGSGNVVLNRGGSDQPAVTILYLDSISYIAEA